jgi:ATP-binding protein involved in chromosome partitioning
MPSHHAMTLTPREIGRANEHDVRVTWSDNSETIFPARKLRLACPCAECVEEMTGRVMVRDSDVPQDVHPLSLHAVGRYAIQVDWSDGHNAGIYTWERLQALARQIVPPAE